MTSEKNNILVVGVVLLVRGVNNALLDTYQLKSLDAVVEANLDKVEFVRNGSKLSVSAPGMAADNFAVREPYDRIVRCLGFKFNDSLFSRYTLFCI